jgi:hypothetical protein
MIQRIDQLTSPVEVGRYYLVPTVTGNWLGRTKAWPIIGPRHSDVQCLKFDDHHYHLDGRFLKPYAYDAYFWRNVGGAPLMLDSLGRKVDLGPPVWRRRLCRYAVSPSIGAVQILAAASPRWQCHFDMWTGTRRSCG